jgi:hypothetical protein
LVFFFARKMESKFILRRRKSIFPHQKYRLSFWTVGIFLFREDAQTLGKCTELKKIWIASVNTAKKNRT